MKTHANDTYRAFAPLDPTRNGARNTYWHVLVRAEVLKLARRGEDVRPDLLRWAEEL